MKLKCIMLRCLITVFTHIISFNKMPFAFAKLEMQKTDLKLPGSVGGGVNWPERGMGGGEIWRQRWWNCLSFDCGASYKTEYVCHNTQKYSLKEFYYNKIYPNWKNGQKEYMGFLCICNLPELELKYFALWNLLSYPNKCLEDNIILLHTI